jgi:hypothetical protein
MFEVCSKFCNTVYPHKIQLNYITCSIRPLLFDFANCCWVLLRPQHANTTMQPCSARECAVSNPEKKQNSNRMLNVHITATTETLILLNPEDNCPHVCDGTESGRLLLMFSRTVLPHLWARWEPWQSMPWEHCTGNSMGRLTSNLI